jgi:uncharacterized protein YndB with AHSA1/START domain
MTATPSSNVSSTADRQMVLTRLLDAPRELVFDVWTDPTHIDQWWGPRGFRNTTSEMEARPGGMWRYVMHGPDGTDFGNRIVYREIVKPERLVYDHGSDVDNDPDSFHVTVTFEEEGGKTKLTMRAVWKSAAAFAEVQKFGVVEGGRQTMDRLEEYLAQTQARRRQETTR